MTAEAGSTDVPILDPRPLRFAGAHAALLVLLLGGCGGAPRPNLVAVDRGAGGVVFLDRELIPRHRIALPRPRLSLRSGATMWLAAEGERGALFVLEGNVPRPFDCGEPPLGVVLALAPGPAAGVFVLAREGHEAACVWRLGAEGGRRLLGTYPDAVALAASAGELLVGCAGGELMRLGLDGALRTQASVPGGVRALAAGPSPGTWWVERGGEPPALELRDARLEVTYNLVAGDGPLSFAPLAGSERVWLVSGDVLRRYGPAGRRELELVLPEGPWNAALATPRGVLLCARGAVLEVRASGCAARVVRTQGGFVEVTTLAGL